jgi:drug/metabolite transporter (DMT)-like permease
MDRSRGTAAALVAAAAFGATAPLAKGLLNRGAGAASLSFLLYLGAFAALGVVAAARRHPTGAPLRRADLSSLVAIALLGGILAPLLLMFGLGRTSGLAGSLLLNLESVLTLLLAVTLFGEHLPRRSALGAVLIVVAVFAISAEGDRSTATLVGGAAIALACAAWALDNNLTQRLSIRDPVRLVLFKTGSASAGLGVIAVVVRSPMPEPRDCVLAVLVGMTGYGLSIVLDVSALRLIGAAREAPLFATAPFTGAVVAVVALGDSVTLLLLVTAAAIAVGVVLLLRDDHAHLHRHDSVRHEHHHRHDDEHHCHQHARPVEGAHTHPHVHEAVEHRHGHASDVHHRHPHEPTTTP